MEKICKREKQIILSAAESRKGERRSLKDGNEREKA